MRKCLAEQFQQRANAYKGLDIFSEVFTGPQMVEECCNKTYGIAVFQDSTCLKLREGVWQIDIWEFK